MVEMREAAHLLANATEQSLILIDELGRGTAATDGQSLAQAILERLAFEVGARTLFATHHHEITALERRSPSIRNLSVGSAEEQDRVIFTHAIQDGPAPRSYGLEVAKLSGLPNQVLRRAGEILTQIPRAAGSGRSDAVQPSLFSPPPPPPPPVVKNDPQFEAIRERLAATDLDALTPREALEVLYDLKGQLR